MNPENILYFLNGISKCFNRNKLGFPRHLQGYTGCSIIYGSDEWASRELKEIRHPLIETKVSKLLDEIRYVFVLPKDFIGRKNIKKRFCLNLLYF